MSTSPNNRFAVVEAQVICNNKLSNGAKVLYLTLCMYSSAKKPYAYPTVGELSSHMGDVHPRSIKRYLSELKSHGYVTRKQTSKGWIYQLNLKIK